jgi:putative membrane protein
MISWLIATVHIFGFGLGLGAVWARGYALCGVPHVSDVKRAFLADNIWVSAGVLLVGTGLLRLFFGSDANAHYLGNHIFVAKLWLVGCIVLLEIIPMLTLIRWRFALAQDDPIRFRPTALVVRVSFVQTFLMLCVLFVATAISHGYGQ